MSAVNVAAAYVKRRAVPALDLALGCQPTAACSGSNDIRDCVNGSDLMEMNSFDRDIVNFSFRAAKEIKCR